MSQSRFIATAWPKRRFPIDAVRDAHSQLAFMTCQRQEQLTAWFENGGDESEADMDLLDYLKRSVLKLRKRDRTQEGMARPASVRSEPIGIAELRKWRFSGASVPSEQERKAWRK